ncbi:hypothetical protein AwDysgo_14580 [Bacteroidales bacterium]|nr:hypothetical protein AwDysgo_14580 [Bacteroidales bacterium]
MRRKNTQSISDILKEVFEENPLLQRKLAETRLLAAWPEILGKSVAQYTNTLYISKEVLYVSLSSAVLRTELSLCREMLIEKLNKSAGLKVISNIVFTA